jgi:hypothetical protein
MSPNRDSRSKTHLKPRDFQNLFLHPAKPEDLARAQKRTKKDPPAWSLYQVSIKRPSSMRLNAHLYGLKIFTLQAPDFKLIL